MKNNSIYIALVFILSASLACNIGSSAPATESIQEPAAATAQTDPAATTIPAQESAAIDGPPGPETIDLTNQGLYLTSSATAYTFDTATKFAGVDKAGSAKEVSMLMTEGTQSLPQKSRHFVVEVTGGEGSAETAVIGDQVYTVFQGACYPYPLSSVEIPAKGWPKLQDEITGQAQRVESGIEVNGFVSDKYELKSENMLADDELVSASVYVARNGGFITLFELQGRTKTDFQGLDPNKFTDVSSSYNFIPVEDGSLEIVKPAACEDPAGTAGASSNPAGLLGEFPVMDGAAGSLIGSESLFFQIKKPAAEVADYYRAEMPKSGWALTEDTIVERVVKGNVSTGPVVSLVFTKEGKNFLVKVDGGGPLTGVTIKEK
jgi:hypothetical protein